MAIQVDHEAFDRATGLVADIGDALRKEHHGSSESEVLFDKGMDFEVIKKVWNDKGYLDIYLKETP